MSKRGRERRRRQGRHPGQGDAVVPAPGHARLARPSEPPLDLTRLEHHRRGFGLAPAPGDAEPGVATWVPAEGGSGVAVTRCTCPRVNCKHLRDLRRAIDTLGDDPERAFARSLWHRLAAVLVAAAPTPRAAVRFARAGSGQGAVLHGLTPDPAGTRLLEYRGDGDDARRLAERLAVPGFERSPRALILERLVRDQETAAERSMGRLGFDTIGQRQERSLWRQVAYHAFREFGAAGRFTLAVDPTSGAVDLVFAGGADVETAGETLRLGLPRAAVAAVVEQLAAAFPERLDLCPLAGAARWVYVFTPASASAFAARAVLEVIGGAGEGPPLRLAAAELAPFHYGHLAWVAPLGRFVTLARADLPAPFEHSRDRLPEVLDAIARELGDDGLEVDPALGPKQVFRRADGLALRPAREGWEWVHVRYRFGQGSVDLRELLAARGRGQRYLATSQGWVDLESEVLDGVAPETAAGDHATGTGPLRFSPLQLFSLQAAAGTAMEVEGEGPASERLGALLDLRPARPFQPPPGLLAPLRPYQERGAAWLLFLHENRLGGLLCDDMGLGKTHQTMALFLALRRDGVDRPFLVVCPTTVLSHWRDKLAAHAPGLAAVVHHGAERELERACAGADVVLTSYGVLRRDVSALARASFAVAVFDEVQALKNRGTQVHEAARQVGADLRLGLTGTPIENAVTDLKALFDVVLPGYLGKDEAFAARYLAEPGDAAAGERLAGLRRLVTPFILRRLKASVLDELPEKIVDLRTCPLSEEQARLYREALRGRGQALVERLRDDHQPVPYVHIFALIDLLKQICDHPALALKQLDAADDHVSGKWELFRELLDESLGSGQKVVVFSHYLGMLELMARLLTSQGVGHVRLTGQSRDRGALVRRFHDDPDCRVFLASLRAGGTGIDLVAASVVIHYDRWWNAAVEDQATDRAHRIGQRRTVQVFKLVTEGTLEERIDALIERKRALMEAVVQPDDPALAKALSRDELLDLLSEPLPARAR